jgi:hypothetical protein
MEGFYYKSNNINKIDAIYSTNSLMLGATCPTSRGAYATTVPKSNFSKAYSLVTRRSARASIGLVWPKNFYHLHALASDLSVGPLDKSP